MVFWALYSRIERKEIGNRLQIVTYVSRARYKSSQAIVVSSQQGRMQASVPCSSWTLTLLELDMIFTYRNPVPKGLICAFWSDDSDTSAKFDSLLFGTKV